MNQIKYLKFIILLFVIVSTMVSVMPKNVNAECMNQNLFVEKISNASEGDIIEINDEGTYKLPTISKNITIKANVNNVIFDCVGTGNIASIPNGCIFENVTFNMGSSNYHGFYHSGLIQMNHCIINGLFFTYGNMNFNECTFNQPSTDYAIWIYAGDVLFNNCKMNINGKFANVYNEGNNPVLNGEKVPWNIYAKGCVFYSTKKNKAAFNVKESCGSTYLHYYIEIEDCKVEGTNFPSSNLDTNASLLVIDPLIQVDDRTSSSILNSSEGNGIKILKDGVILYGKINNIKPVASINGIGYENLYDAVQSVKKDETIILLDDIVTDRITIDKNYPFTINFNNHQCIFKCSSVNNLDNPCITILKDASVNIQNGTILVKNKNSNMVFLNYGALLLNKMKVDATPNDFDIKYIIKTCNSKTSITDSILLTKQNKASILVEELETTKETILEFKGSTEVTGTLLLNIKKDLNLNYISITKDEEIVLNTMNGYRWNENKKLEVDKTPNTYTVQATSILLKRDDLTDCDTITATDFAHVKGIGKYLSGTSVTLVTGTGIKDYENIEFVGWYLEDDITLSYPISTSKVLQIPQVLSNEIYVAVYKTVKETEINIVLSNLDNSLGLYKIKNIYTKEEVISKLSETRFKTNITGGTLQLEYIGEDKEAVYWLDEANRIIGEGNTIVLNKFNDINIKVITKDKSASDNQLLINFMSNYGQVIKSCLYSMNANESFNFPEIPSMVGYLGLGWNYKGKTYEEGMEETFINEIESIINDNLTKVIYLYPQYKKLEKDNHANVLIYINDSNVETKDVTIGSGLLIDASIYIHDEKEEFVCFKIGNNIVSYSPIYYFVPTHVKDYEVHVLVEQKKENERIKPLVTTIITETSVSTKQNDKNKYEMTITYNVPNGYELIETGLYYSNDSNLIDKYHYISSLNTKMNTYKVTIKMKSSVLYAYAYVIYMDSEGNTYKVQSNSVLLNASV